MASTFGRKMGKLLTRRRGSFDLQTNVDDSLTTADISRPLNDFRTVFHVGFHNGEFIGLPLSWQLKLSEGQLR